MPNCGPSTLIISTATTNNLDACSASNCGDIGPADCLDSNKLTPRRSRGKVIEQAKDYVLLMLGAPVLDVELTDQQLELCVKQTLKIMEYYAPRDLFRYHVFTATPGQSVYQMPPDVGYIRSVHYKQTAEFAFTSADLGGAIPVEYFYPGGAYASIQGGLIDPIQPIWGRAGDWMLYKSYERMYTRMSSQIGGWEFIGGYKHIKLYPLPSRPSKVIVHYLQKCHDWEDFSLAAAEGSLAQAKMILGTIRKKFQGLPGPGGTIQLDGEQMYQEGKEEYKQWKEDLIYKYGDILFPSTG